MPDHHNGAVGSLCHIGQSAKNRAYLIGPVHIHIGSKKGLQGVNDNQTGVVLSDRIFNTLICQGQRIVGIVNNQHSLQICLGRKQPRLHRIPQTVLSRLKNHIEWFKWLHLGQKLSIGAGCHKLHGKEGFALTGVALNDR